MNIPLNILCQSPVSENMTPAQAMRNTVDLAKHADALGYHRFWVAEHHSDQALASGAPEVLVAHIASVTERIRVGSGGVLLPYYSPFKVAEQFNALAALFPDRIDLGLGRSGGSEGHAPSALGVRSSGPAAFAAIDELLSWLGPGSAKRPYPSTFASPQIDESAQPWILGTSPASATFAAKRGLAYAFGGFLDPRGMMPALAAYHQNFTPGRSGAGPRVNIAWNVCVGETESEANHLAKTMQHWFVRTMMRRENPRFQPPEAADPSQYSPSERMMVQMMRQIAFVGSAEQVLDQIEALTKQTSANEVTLVTIPYAHQARVASYTQLMAAA
ncbi:MAG: LLM class flavin-dependent oxidoreductase [Myxococcota bacterium]